MGTVHTLPASGAQPAAQAAQAPWIEPPVPGPRRHMAITVSTETGQHLMLGQYRSTFDAYDAAFDRYGDIAGRIEVQVVSADEYARLQRALRTDRSFCLASR